MMQKYRKMLRAKIHRATVTHADVAYEGSLTMPPEFFQLADLVEYEALQVWNTTTGSRLETYAIMGEKGSRTICANGAAAHLIRPGDVIIIACFCDIEESMARDHKPLLVFVDEKNNPKPTRPEIPGPRLEHSKITL